LVHSSQSVAETAFGGPRGQSAPPTPALPPDELACLADRLAGGDVDALAIVIGTVGPRVAAGLSRRHPALRAEDIEDVLSIASQRLWESRTQYDLAKGSLAAWFFIIADNAAKDLVKKEARRLEQSAEVRYLVKAEPTPPDEPVAEDAARQGLHEILLGLAPLDHRIIWAYAEAGGAGAWAADLSHELGMRAGTIRVRCSRIKERIRKTMHARMAPVTSNAF